MMKQEDFCDDIYCQECKSEQKQSILRINTLYDKKNKQVIFECKTCDSSNDYFMSKKFCGVFEQ